MTPAINTGGQLSSEISWIFLRGYWDLRLRERVISKIVTNNDYKNGREPKNY